MSILTALQPLLATPEPPELGPGGRAESLSVAALDRKLSGLLDGLGLEAAASRLVRALVLLWHDHLEPAHEIAQEVKSEDGSYVHAIMHRREPDYGNAKYWFRRVGQHPCFPGLAERAGRYLDEEGLARFGGKFIAGRRWDPAGFVDACEQAAGTGDTAEVRALREIQRMEIEGLLEFLAAASATAEC